jgi:hypothetical protein
MGRTGFAFVTTGDGKRTFVPCRLLGAAIDRHGAVVYLVEYPADDGAWIATRTDRLYGTEAAARIIARHAGTADTRLAARYLEDEMASGHVPYAVWERAVLDRRPAEPAT